VHVKEKFKLVYTHVLYAEFNIFTNPENLFC